MCRVFLRIERSPLRQQESVVDSCASVPASGDVVEFQEDDDTVSLVSREELARDDAVDFFEVVPADTGAVIGLSIACSVPPSSDATTAPSHISRSSSLKSDEKSTPASAAGARHSTLVESTLVSEDGLSADVDRLPVASSCDVGESSSKSSSVPSSSTVINSSTTESLPTTQTSRSRVTTASASKMAAVPPLAKKGLTHLLNSSSALFHRRRQLRADSESKNVSVSYSGSSVSLAESVALSDVSVGLGETGVDSQSQNIDTNIVPVVCDDVTFLMIKDDFCQKPTDLSAVDRAEDSSSLSYKDSCLSSKTSAASTGEVSIVADSADKVTSDTVSLSCLQVSSHSLLPQIRRLCLH